MPENNCFHYRNPLFISHLTIWHIPKYRSAFFAHVEQQAPAKKEKKLQKPLFASTNPDSHSFFRKQKL
jgi:hypothetical protein